MKRNRVSVKKYVESSDSEDDRPLKKTPPSREKTREGSDSSSESDMESYAWKPNKMDLDSEFFNPKQPQPEFENIEKNIFSGITCLSDSESDINEEESPNPTENSVSPEKGTPDVGLPTDMAFKQLQEYTTKMEEAKRFVEIYKAKKKAEENKTDIQKLLAEGESSNMLKYNITPADLHSSDFESCESEEDWQEIKNKPVHDREKQIIPKKNIQIMVDMPDTVKKKKGIDIIAAMKRRLNCIRKENQVLVHKVHLLCWIAHGNYINSILNQTEILAMALSLMPSEHSYPSDRPDLSYLEQIVKWYKRTITNIEKPVPDDIPLDKCLHIQMNRKQAYNKKMLACIFVALLRSLGIPCRIVMSLQVEPLRPPENELHSLSTKDQTKNRSNTKIPSHHKSKPSCSDTSKVKQGEKKIVSKSKDESVILKSGSKTIKKEVNSESKPNLNKLKNRSAEKIEISEKCATVRTRNHTNVDAKTSRDKNIVLPKKGQASKSSTGENDIGENEPNEILVSKKGGPAKTSNASSENPQVISKTRKGRSAKSLETKELKKCENSEKDLKSISVPQKRKSTKSPAAAEPSVSTTSEDKTSISEKDLKNLSVPKTRKSTKSPAAAKPSVSTTSEDKISISEKDVKAPKKRSCVKIAEPKDSVEITVPKRGRSTKNLTSQTSENSKDKKAKSDTNLNVPKIKRTKSMDGHSSELVVKVSENRSKSAEKLKSKNIPQIDGAWDSDSDFDGDILQVDGADDVKKVSSKPNLKTLNKVSPKMKTSSPKKRRESVESESEFHPPEYYDNYAKRHVKPNLKKLNNSPKQLDVKKDIVKLIKGRISEQKHIDHRKMASKRKPMPDDDSDSDYAPEPIKKKHHDSDDEFSPKVKVKRRVQIPGKEQEPEKPPKKKGNDVWVEVFLEAEEKWISVDLVHGQVHCVKELYQRATHPVSYVIAWDNNNHVKDVTQRYCLNFNTITRKQRIGQKWWQESIRSFLGTPTARDKEEDDDLARQQLDQPLPKSIGEYKNHPLYALKRHLLKFEAIYPPEPPTLGFIRGEAVYSRSCVFVLHSRDIWLKQAKVVKLGEQPYKIVKARPKYDKLSNKVITDQLLEIFGPWQVDDYVPPTAENGIVPKNAFGNVDLFKPCMLPKRTVHLQLPGLNKVARKMNIDCAAAIIGFDFHGGWSHPVYDGFVVCEEYKDQLILAWDIEQEEIDRKEQERIDKRVYGNWKRLIKGLLIRERLKAKYDFGEPSTSSTKESKKHKTPTFCTKKR